VIKSIIISSNVWQCLFDGKRSNQRSGTRLKSPPIITFNYTITITITIIQLQLNIQLQQL